MSVVEIKRQNFRMVMIVMAIIIMIIIIIFVVTIIFCNDEILYKATRRCSG